MGMIEMLSKEMRMEYDAGGDYDDSVGNCGKRYAVEGIGVAAAQAVTKAVAQQQQQS